MTAGYHYKNWILCIPVYCVTMVELKVCQSLNPVVWGRYPEAANMICFSMFDIVNVLLKKNKCLILFSWFSSALVVGGRLMAA